MRPLKDLLPIFDSLVPLLNAGRSVMACGCYLYLVYELS